MKSDQTNMIIGLHKGRLCRSNCKFARMITADMADTLYAWAKAMSGEDGAPFNAALYKRGAISIISNHKHFMEEHFLSRIKGH